MDYYDAGGSPINYHPRFGGNGVLHADIALIELEGIDPGYVHVHPPLEVKHMTLTQRHYHKKGKLIVR